MKQRPASFHSQAHREPSAPGSLRMSVPGILESRDARSSSPATAAASSGDRTRTGAQLRDLFARGPCALTRVQLSFRFQSRSLQILTEPSVWQAVDSPTEIGKEPATLNGPRDGVAASNLERLPPVFIRCA